MASAARPVVTLGLHGSASTWVFNVVRRLLGHALGEAAVQPCHVLDEAQLMARIGAGRRVVAKSHGWPGILEAVRRHDALVVVSVRDPRDALLSQMERFGTTYEIAVQAIGRDCQAVYACAGAGLPTLRYESRFFENPVAVRALAQLLAVDVDEATVAEIFAALSTAAIRAFSGNLQALPTERLEGGGGFLFDRLTQITNAHIGDGHSGKWRERLDAAQRAQTTRLFAPFLHKFGYPAE